MDTAAHDSSATVIAAAARTAQSGGRIAAAPITVPDGPPANPNYVPAEALEQAVLEALRQAFVERISVEAVERTARALRRAATKHLRQLEERVTKCEDEMVDAVGRGMQGEIDAEAADMLIGRLRAQIQELSEQRAMCQQSLDALDLAGDKLHQLIADGTALLSEWEHLTPQERAEMLRTVVLRVLVTPAAKMATVHLREVLPEIPRLTAAIAENAGETAADGDKGVSHATGSGGGIRTPNLVVNSHPLYP